MHSSGKINWLLKKMLFALTILGFPALAAQTEAARPVVIMVGDQSMEGCVLLGKVKGSSRENDWDDNAPYVDRLIKARNNLREEAQKLGANTVHIVNSNTSGKYEVPGASKEIIHIGNAYRCE